MSKTNQKLTQALSLRENINEIIFSTESVTQVNVVNSYFKRVDFCNK